MPSFRNKRTYHRNIYHVLKDWYGKERAGREMVSYCPPADALGSLLDGIMSKALPPEEIELLKIKNEWAQIAGADLARICEPISIKEGIVEIAVSHPAWLQELRGPVKKRLIANINHAAQKDFCRDLRFVPGGRTAKPQ